MSYSSQATISTKSTTIVSSHSSATIPPADLEAQSALTPTPTGSRRSNPPPQDPHDSTNRNWWLVCDELASLLATDGEIQIFRKFSALSLRSILILQRELTRLEERLKQLNLKPPDARDPEATKIFESKQLAISREITKVYKEFTEAVSSHKTLQSFNQSSIKDRQLDAYKRFLNEQLHVDSSFLDNKEDLFSFVNRSHEGFFGFIYGQRWIIRLLQTKVDKKKTKSAPGQDDIVYYSEERVHTLRRILMLLAGWMFLIVPLVVLAQLENMWRKIGTICGFVMAFSTILALFTRASDWEVYAATAAYCAVLAVFLQI